MRKCRSPKIEKCYINDPSSTSNTYYNDCPPKKKCKPATTCSDGDDCVIKPFTHCVIYDGDQYSQFGIFKNQNLNEVLTQIISNLNPQIYTEDTDSIDFSGLGLISNKLKADVKISAISDNILIIEPDGLYVPETIVPPPSTPNLQEVTDEGNVTTNAIVVKGSDNVLQGDGAYITHVLGGGSSFFSGDPSIGFVGSLVMSSAQVALHSPADSGVGKPLNIISSGVGGFISLQSELLSLNGDVTVTSVNPVLFNVRVKGEDAIDLDDFVTLAQLNALPDGTVTSVGLTSSDITVGGTSPITGAGTFTLTLPNIVSPNTFNNVTFNAKGQVTGGSNIAYLTTETDPVANAKTVTLNVGTGLSRTVGAAIQTIGANPSFTLVNTAPDQVVVLSNGTGISTSGTYPNFTITNTSPDQAVTLSNGTGISTTGTYPNFTITNTLPDQTVIFTNGTGISVTGTYPNFTITNTAPFTGSYINNNTSPQAGASFNIGGSGTIGTNFTVTNGVVSMTGDITFATTPSGGITFNFDGGNGTGDIFYRSSTGKLARLPIGSGVLGNSGGIPAWVPAGGTGTVTSIGLTSSDITIGGTSPITTSGTYTLTLPNINANIGTFNTLTVNAKGQVTAASNTAYITSSSSDNLTNKTGNISQWTNDAGYLTSFTESDPIANAKTVTLSNGTGISISGAAQTISSNPAFTITNTAPDQTVVLNDGAGISVTGSYPNFTITNTLPYDGVNKELTIVIDNIDLLAGGTYQVLAPVGNIVLFTFGKMEIRNLVFGGVGSLVANWTMGTNATNYNDMESYTGATIQTTDPIGSATNVITASSNRSRNITGTGVSFKITPSTNSGGFTTATGRLIYKYILLSI